MAEADAVGAIQPERRECAVDGILELRYGCVVRIDVLAARRSRPNAASDSEIGTTLASSGIRAWIGRRRSRNVTGLAGVDPAGVAGIGRKCHVVRVSDSVVRTG